MSLHCLPTDNMAGKVVMLLSVLLLVTFAGQPSCGDMVEILPCPMNLAPVCGSDGNTYPNECALCVQRQETRMDILVMKEESC